MATLTNTILIGNKVSLILAPNQNIHLERDGKKMKLSTNKEKSELKCSFILEDTPRTYQISSNFGWTRDGYTEDTRNDQFTIRIVIAKRTLYLQSSPSYETLPNKQGNKKMKIQTNQSDASLLEEPRVRSSSTVEKNNNSYEKNNNIFINADNEQNSEVVEGCAKNAKAVEGCATEAPSQVGQNKLQPYNAYLQQFTHPNHMLQTPQVLNSNYFTTPQSIPYHHMQMPHTPLSSSANTLLGLQNSMAIANPFGAQQLPDLFLATRSKVWKEMSWLNFHKLITDALSPTNFDEITKEVLIINGAIECCEAEVREFIFGKLTRPGTKPGNVIKLCNSKFSFKKIYTGDWWALQRGNAALDNFLDTLIKQFPTSNGELEQNGKPNEHLLEKLENSIKSTDKIDKNKIREFDTVNELELYVIRCVNGNEPGGTSGRKPKTAVSEPQTPQTQTSSTENSQSQATPMTQKSKTPEASTEQAQKPITPTIPAQSELPQVQTPLRSAMKTSKVEKAQLNIVRPEQVKEMKTTEKKIEGNKNEVKSNKSNTNFAYILSRKNCGRDLPTAEVKIVQNQKSIYTKALLDSGSSSTLISSFFTKKLAIPG